MAVLTGVLVGLKATFSVGLAVALGKISVAVEVAVLTGVAVLVEVLLAVGGTGVSVTVRVAVRVAVRVKVDVDVAGTGVSVTVLVAVRVAVRVKEGVGELVRVLEGVGEAGGQIASVCRRRLSKNIVPVFCPSIFNMKNSWFMISAVVSVPAP